MKSKRQKRSQLKRVGIIGALLLIVGAGVWFAMQRGIPEGVGPDQVAHMNEQATTTERPVRLVIDAIGVDANIEPVGVTDDGAMAAPDELDVVGWYNQSSQLGDTSFAMLLDGHYGDARTPGVFHRLGELDEGDTIQVVGDGGRSSRFRITKKELQPLEQVNMVDALSHGKDRETLTIITCEGVYDASRQTYEDRLVVYAEKQ